MTREDMLRELELLPAWQLRAPVAREFVVKMNLAPVEETQRELQADVSEQKVNEISAPVVNLRMLMSEDAQYLFLLAPLQTSEEETLLQNMLKALHVKTRTDIGLQSISNLSAYSPKIIIAMGEAAAQGLGLATTLDALRGVHDIRGQVHQTAFGLVAVTFSPAHLILNNADKALAWHDLCLAKLTIEAL